ncbi:MAG TPA: DsbA family protein [Acidimicrobiia bacterium]|jgi:2-hydroxychromene-2-carboxylate isomerase
MPRSIAVTFDYRCPFAYNGNAATIAATRGGADLDVRYVPFSLDQAHVEEGEPPVWERAPGAWGTGVLALLYGIAVRDAFPDQFEDAHLALFAARHDKGLKLGHEDVLRDAVTSAGLDPDGVAEEVQSGRPLAALAAEHTEAVTRWGVWGVPTFIEGDEAAFVRFMERGRVDDLERMLELLSWTRFNEFKRPTVPR